MALEEQCLVYLLKLINRVAEAGAGGTKSLCKVCRLLLGGKENILNYKSKISDEMLENGFSDNSFTRRDTDGFYIKLQSFIDDDRIAANVLVLAIRQAGIETTSYDTRDIEFQVDNFIQRETKTISEAKAIVEKRNKKPVKKGDVRETVQDWDKQKVDGITPEQQEHLDDLMLWFDDRDKYHGAEDETYKQIATFDDWQEWRKKRAISGN